MEREAKIFCFAAVPVLSTAVCATRIDNDPEKLFKNICGRAALSTLNPVSRRPCR